MRLIPYLFLFSLLVFSSCKKEEEEAEIEYITGNVAPPDNTVEDVTYKNYVSKLYIAVLGRKATDAELSSGVTLIKSANASAASREQLVKTVFSNPEFYSNEYTIMKADYLNGIDTAEINDRLEVYKFLLTTTTNPIFLEIYQYEVDRAEVLVDLENDLLTGAKNMVEAHATIVNNGLYDDINMGTENFVVSLFQNFFLRYPTDVELANGKTIVDGAPAVFLLSSGNTKDELIDIFFNSSEYFEGQVRINFLRFLYREPTESEISTLASKYKTSRDYKAMQLYILTTDEYIGIK